MVKQKITKKPTKTLIFLLKVLLFATLFITFFWAFGIENPQIVRFSRTAAITMTTFLILGISMTAVYGGFAIGKKKSKEIASSLAIAAFITDFVTYFQFLIMRLTEENHVFSVVSVGVFFLVFILQIFEILIFTYFGNFIYFKMNPPEKCTVICSDLELANQYVARLKRFKKQYTVTDIISYDNADIKQYIRHCDSIFIFDIPPKEKSEIIDYAYKHYINIYFNTELSDIVTNYAKYTVLDDISMLSSTTKELSIEQRFIKRTIDIVISLILIIITSPFMIVEALAIKLYDHGPVFFKQKRATLNGKEFEVLKFRTMIVDADKKLGMHPAGEKDDRITPVGRVLRKIRLDELPQFFNILKGDMSIVGPRPERLEHVEMYTQELPEFQYRLRAKAGLTGLAQIAGKYNTSPKDKLMLDLMYIEKYSVWQDILLMFQTLKVFFKSDSTEAFTEDKNVEFVKYNEEEYTPTETSQNTDKNSSNK